MQSTELRFWHGLKFKILLIFFLVLVIPLMLLLIDSRRSVNEVTRADYSRRLAYAGTLFRESLEDQMTSLQLHAKTLCDSLLYTLSIDGFTASTTQPIFQNEILRYGLDYVAVVKNGQEILTDLGDPPPFGEGLPRILSSLCYTGMTANIFVAERQPWIFSSAEVTRNRQKDRYHLVYAVKLAPDFGDRFKRFSGSEFSIIYGGKRLVTTLMDIYGKRMIETVPTNFESLIGEMDVMTNPHLYVREELLKGKLSEAFFLEISVPKSEYVTLRNDISHKFTIFGGLGLLLALMAGTILAINIANPLKNLYELTTRVAEGDYTVQTVSDRKDEIGLLTRNFQSMVNSLKAERELKESRMRELSTLFEISNAVNFITDSEELLKFVLTNAIEILEAERGSIMLLDDQTDELAIKVAYGGRFRVMSTSNIKIGHGVCGLVAKDGVGRISNDGFRDKEFKNFGSLIPVEDIRTLLVSPLKFKEGTIGVINVVNKRQDAYFNENDLALLNLIASQAAVTIENNKLYELSITDGLTRLFVHRYFQARLSEELLRARRYGLKLSLIMIDIDNFKRFNDAYGHQVGDQVLQRVATAMRETIRTGIDIPCRYGGEELSIILPETRGEESFLTAERVRESIAALTISHPLGNVRITCSLGVASYPNDALDLESLIRVADKAMYHSKSAGKNCTTLAAKLTEPA